VNGMKNGLFPSKLVYEGGNLESVFGSGSITGSLVLAGGGNALELVQAK
jgi:hypothetical protein